MNTCPHCKQFHDSTACPPPDGPPDITNLRAWRAYHDQFAVDYRSPEEKAALDGMHKHHEELRKLGWRDAIYCPKDGSKFLVVTAGSTGVFPCHYDGQWPKGTWWVHDGGDLWPSRPILWKPIPSENTEGLASTAGSEKPKL